MYLDNRNGLKLTLIKIGNESNIQKTLAVANFYQSTKVDTIGRHGKFSMYLGQCCSNWSLNHEAFPETNKQKFLLTGGLAIINSTLSCLLLSVDSIQVLYLAFAYKYNNKVDLFCSYTIF
jgi:hypothetical protein